LADPQIDFRQRLNSTKGSSHARLTHWFSQVNILVRFHQFTTQSVLKIYFIVTNAPSSVLPRLYHFLVAMRSTPILDGNDLALIT